MDKIVIALLIFYNVVGHSQKEYVFQGKYPRLPYAENKVKEVKELLVYANDTLQNTLIRHEFFNEMAFLYLRYIYSDEGQLSSIDSFIYKHDTIPIMCITENLELNKVYKTYYEFDKEGFVQGIKISSNDTIILYSHFKWNKKRTKLKIISDSGKQIVEFDKMGRLISITYKDKYESKKGIKRFENEFTSDGYKITKAYFSDSNKAFVETIELSATEYVTINHTKNVWYDLDYANDLSAQPGDTISKKMDYSENGLINHKARYLNNILESKIAYQYTYW
ncbi:MAG TPA: hypothetical protein P5235_00715 [Saprospiraceae bacterium]|nr:hypothetical protein [Saprospiraceae bacterium]